jgi:hypothetical protein
MVKKEVVKYFNFSLLAYDYKNRLYENEKENMKYKLSNFKLKELNIYRKSSILKKFSNNDTDTEFLIGENDKEIIISFKEPKILQDWFISHLCSDEIGKRTFKSKNFPSLIEMKTVNPFKNREDVIGNEVFTHFNENKGKIYLNLHQVMLFNSISEKLDFMVDVLVKSSKIKSIIFTGYGINSILSRIGFVNTLLKYKEYAEKIKCCCFSTPRMGNKVFEEFMKIIKKRYDNIDIYNIENDILVKGPPKCLGYGCVQNTVNIPKSNNFIYNTTTNNEIYLYLYSLQEM